MEINKMKGGATTWYFPDGYLPEKTEGKMEAHEAIMIMNVNNQIASVKMDIYFENRAPVKDISIKVGAERVVSIHLDIPEQTGGFQIPPLTQYAVRLRSNIPVVAMFGRLDTTQPNMTYYTVSPYSE
jgi:hypothetical protein